MSRQILRIASVTLGRAPAAGPESVSSHAAKRLVTRSARHA
jgi:hypothetical protein